MTNENDGGQPSFRLETKAPYNLAATVRLLQRRPANRVDHWEAGRYLRAFQTPDGSRLITVANAGTIDAPDLRLEIQGGSIGPETARGLVETIRWVLGLDADPAPTAWLTEMEPRFAATASILRGFRPPCFPTMFETCARVIPFQQLSLDAGTAIAGRLIDRFGVSMTVDGRAWVVFPEPEAIAKASIESLRETGLSRAKSSALQALAERAIAGELDAKRYQTLSTIDALKQLRGLPGIGPWSAAVMLLRGLRRMDVFPTGDAGAARSLPALLGVPLDWSADDACRFAERFGEQRGYLYFLGLGAQLASLGLLEPDGGESSSGSTANAR